MKEIEYESFNSWAHTYGVMCYLTHDRSGSNGKIAFLETLSEWAAEFENKYTLTNWEEVQWDETLEDFLMEKLNNTKY